MHKDTEFTLTACERHDQPQERMIRDLIENREYAKIAIAAANRFFRFDFSKVRFSGFAREHDEWDGQPSDHGPAYYIELWHGGQSVRKIGIRSLGILGTLHVNVIPDNLEDAIQLDILGAINRAVNEERDIDPEFPRFMCAKMDEQYLYLEIDTCP